MDERAVDAEDVRHVAELARVDLADAEVDRYVAEFSEILEYFDRLDEVPTVDGDVEIENVLRSDEVRPSLSRDEAMRNAPDRDDGYFKGPPVG